MARISFSGYAINDPNTGGNLDGLGTATRDAFNRNGFYSAKCDSGAGNSAKSCSSGASRPVTVGQVVSGYSRRYIYLNDLPGSTICIANCVLSNPTSGDGLVGVTLDSTGHLYAHAMTNNSAASVVTLSPGTWYRLEVKVTVDWSGAVVAPAVNDVLLDGVSLGLSATAGSSASPVSYALLCTSGWVQAPGANKVCYVSDAALNDDTGANQNTYPGAGMCVLLVPTATSAAAAKWLDNDGTQTNMWQGAANTPPAGIAAATSPSHAYIKHTGGAAGTTDAFDATMKTYLAAGIKQVDTVNVIQYYIVTGEESGTGTKLLAIAGVSNPVVAQSSSFDVFAASGAQGIYPSNWSLFRTQLAMQYSPSVVVGTAPVYRVVRPETASRVASVCAMYMYVDYTPAVSLLKPMRAAVLGV